MIVFLPRILLLFFFIGVMEASGYMARVAFLMDRLMKSIGLHGRAFVPMMSGFACAGRMFHRPWLATPLCHHFFGGSGPGPVAGRRVFRGPVLPEADLAQRARVCGAARLRGGRAERAGKVGPAHGATASRSTATAAR